MVLYGSNILVGNGQLFSFVLYAWFATFVAVINLSTILGFIPFMIGEDKEAFWFPLAAGTIGGLIMSVIGIFIFLPFLTLKRKNKK